MSKSALTVKVFGIYLLVLGVCLTVLPNLLLSMFGIAQTTEVWIRVLGVVVFNVGIYYWYAAQSEAKEFFPGLGLRTDVGPWWPSPSLRYWASPVPHWYCLVRWILPAPFGPTSRSGPNSEVPCPSSVRGLSRRHAWGGRRLTVRLVFRCAQSVPERHTVHVLPKHQQQRIVIGMCFLQCLGSSWILHARPGLGECFARA